MTAIVGIQGKDWALIAADSMTTYDDKPYYAKGQDKVVEQSTAFFEGSNVRQRLPRCQQR